MEGNRMTRERSQDGQSVIREEKQQETERQCSEDTHIHTHRGLARSHHIYFHCSQQLDKHDSRVIETENVPQEGQRRYCNQILLVFDQGTRDVSGGRSPHKPSPAPSN